MSRRGFLLLLRALKLSVGGRGRRQIAPPTPLAVVGAKSGTCSACRVNLAIGGDSAARRNRPAGAAISALAASRAGRFRMPLVWRRL